MPFKDARQRYCAALKALHEAHTTYRQERARAVLAADGKNAEQREAQVELATAASREAYDHAKANEQIARADIDFAIAHAHGGALAIAGKS